MLEQAYRFDVVGKQIYGHLAAQRALRVRRLDQHGANYVWSCVNFSQVSWKNKHYKICFHLTNSMESHKYPDYHQAQFVI